MSAVVRWSPKVRALPSLGVAFCCWLAWYSFTSLHAPSVPAGITAIAMAIGGVVLQLQMLRFRLVATDDGLTKTTLFGETTIPWSDVLQVEAIGRAQHGDVLLRFATRPEDAFDIVVHTKQGRIGVNRHMSGIDALIAELRVRRGGADYRTAPTSPVERQDPSVDPVLKPRPAVHAAVAVTTGLKTAWVLFSVGFLSLAFGFVMAATSVKPTGSFLVDGAIDTTLPWLLAYGVYRLVCRAREKRFGPPRARWELGARDAALLVFAAYAGPLSLYAFIPRARASGEAVDLVLCAVGIVLVAIPIRDIRRALREP